MVKEYKNTVELEFSLSVTVNTNWSEEGLKGYFRSGTVLNEMLRDTLGNFFILSTENLVQQIGIELLNDDYDLPFEKA